VRPVWVSPPRPDEGLTALAVWSGDGSRPWLLAAAARTHRLVLFDAATGELLRELGVAGERPGQFRDPADVAVAGDLAFVAESGNGRVQVLRLPGLSTVGFLGGGELRRPVALAVEARGTGLVLWVADEAAAEGEGPRHRAFELGPDGLPTAAGGGKVGEGAAPARPAPPGRDVAPLPCLEGRWLAAARDEALVLLDGDLAPAGGFRIEGPTAGPTVAVAGAPGPLPGLPGGALYALAADGSIAALDVGDLGRALGRATTCGAP
jgi:hypothetical protein